MVVMAIPLTPNVLMYCLMVELISILPLYYAVVEAVELIKQGTS